jgi:hypothetical protein
MSKLTANWRQPYAVVQFRGFVRSILARYKTRGRAERHAAMLQKLQPNVRTEVIFLQGKD